MLPEIASKQGKSRAILPPSSRTESWKYNPYNISGKAAKSLQSFNSAVPTAKRKLYSSDPSYDPDSSIIETIEEARSPIEEEQPERHKKPLKLREVNWAEMNKHKNESLEVLKHEMAKMNRQTSFRSDAPYNQVKESRSHSESSHSQLR